MSPRSGDAFPRAAFSATLALALVSPPGYALAESAFVRPAVGYVAQDSPPELRAILGVSGAAVFSDPILLPKGTTRLRIAPGQQYAIIARPQDTLAALLLNGSEPGETIPIPGVVPQFDLLSFSPSGGSAVLVSQVFGRLQIITGLPQAPALVEDIDLRVLPEMPVNAAVGDNAGPVLVSSGSAVYQVLPDGSASIVLNVTRTASIAFFPSSIVAALGDPGTGSLYLFQRAAGAVAAPLLASGLGAIGPVTASQDGSTLYVADTQQTRIWSVNSANGEVRQLQTPVNALKFDRLAGADIFLISSEPGQPGWIFFRTGNDGGTVFVPAPAPTIRTPHTLLSTSGQPATDASTNPAAPVFTLSVSAQPTTITDQPGLTLNLSQPYPLALTASLTLSFLPNAAGLPSSGYLPSGTSPGAALQFATGGTSATISIPANATTAALPSVQVGDVAGTITVTLAGVQTANGQLQLPSPPPSATITVPPLAPIISSGSVEIVNVTASGFAVDLVATSTPRDLASASFTFTPATGAQLNGTSFTASLSDAAAAWFSSAAGQAAGGAFNLLVPFPFSGNVSALGSVCVTLTNSLGTSQPICGIVTNVTITGGQCPTFIQVSSLATPERRLKSAGGLAARIAVPVEGALLRSDIPIFGEAGGVNFKEYRVEYGEGANPSKWTLIQSSTTPQPTNHVRLADIPSMEGDMDIRGNLATWNTGLKEWVHLPWHPAEDPTDLRGAYAIRLVVLGKDGKSVEDRVTVEVGRVISQVLPGDAISTDGKVKMHFEPLSLQAPFRVYTIKPLTKDIPAIPPGLELVGSAYTIREPGDQFLKPVALRFQIDAKEPHSNLSQFGIYSYDAKLQQWQPLETFQSTEPNMLEAGIFSLPEPVAYFAVLRGSTARSVHRPRATSEAVKTPKDDAILVFDTFETGLGEWAARDRAFGGTAARDQTSTPDGTYSLKITNQSIVGDFAVTAVSTPFRADIYPLVNFDYRIGPGVKTDFYARIGQTWYRIGFTGDESQFRNSDVGISPIGSIQGVLADDQWHSASFDLNRMLATRTARRDVEEIVMANWRVAGYMKLDFGENARGAAFYIDNFKIRRGEDTLGSAKADFAPLVIDDFEGTMPFNRLGGGYDIFSNPGTQNVMMSRVALDSSAGGGQALSLKYDVTRPGSFGGYWSQLRGAPGGEFDQIAFRVKSAGVSSGFLVGLKRRDGLEPKIPAERYWGPAAADGWRDVAIPLAAFGTPSELAALDVFSISFANASGLGKGELMIDDVRLEHGLTSVLIADFEEDPNMNRLMQKNWVFTRGAAAIAVSPQKADSQPGSQTLRISYGGTIGLDLGSGDFSYAGWVAGLGGINASHAQALRFRIRGQTGGEKFNVYLDDGNRRKPVDSSKYVAVTRDWKDVSIPMEAFAGQGVDISHLEELQLVFEWEQMSGTIYVDDIRLTGSQPSKPTAATVGNGLVNAEPRPQGAVSK